MTSQRKNNNVINNNKLESEEYLDESEQNEIIKNFQMESNNFIHKFRRIFAILMSLCSLLMIICFFHFIIYPYNLIHELRFEGNIPNYIFCYFYLFNMIVFSGASVLSSVKLILFIILYYIIYINYFNNYFYNYFKFNTIVW